METVIIKGHGSLEVSRLLARTTSRLLQLVVNGVESYSPRRRGWNNFRSAVSGRSVPYRVWLRHSALLEEINRQHHGQ